MNWKENLIDRPSDIRDLILKTQRIAVLGIKTEAQADQPAFYVPKYLVTAGFDVIPVPVYYPEVIEILSKRVYRRLTEIPEGATPTGHPLALSSLVAGPCAAARGSHSNTRPRQSTEI